MLEDSSCDPLKQVPYWVTGGCDMFGLCDVQCQCVLLGKGHSQSVLHEGRMVLSQMADAEEAATKQKTLPLPHEFNFFQKLTTISHKTT